MKHILLSIFTLSVLFVTPSQAASEKETLCKSLLQRSIALVEKSAKILKNEAQKKAIAKQIVTAKAGGIGSCMKVDIKSIKQQEKVLALTEQKLEKLSPSK